MAAPSRPPSFKAYRLKPACTGCGRKLSAQERLWFQSLPFPAVYGFACCALTNRTSGSASALTVQETPASDPQNTTTEREAA